VAIAFREGRITQMQAEVMLRAGNGAPPAIGPHWAKSVTLRRLEDELPEGSAGEVRFWAPREVAALFVGLARRVGLEALLDHAIATWLRAGRAFRDYADFARDGWRCTVPACTARRNLHSHHIRFLSAGGTDESWNRTTLCAHHHLRGVHTGQIAIRGRAPEALVYELGVGRFASGDVSLGT